MCCGISPVGNRQAETLDQWSTQSQDQSLDHLPTLPSCVFSCKTLRPSSRPVPEEASRDAEDEIVQFNTASSAVQARGSVKSAGKTHLQESNAASAQLLGRARNWIVLAEYDKAPKDEEKLVWQFSEPVARSDLLLLNQPDVDATPSMMERRVTTRSSQRIAHQPTPSYSWKGEMRSKVKQTFDRARKRVAVLRRSVHQAIPYKVMASEEDSAASKSNMLLAAEIYAARLLYLLLFLTALLIAAVVTVGNSYGDNFMIFYDSPMRGDPNYLVDFLGGKCLYLKRTFGSLLLDIESHNKRLGWTEVVFPARGDKREVRALYFPAAARSPRVVLAHGIAANYLDSTVQTTAHFLRYMNVSSLVPNLRNHAGGSKALNGEQFREWRDQFLDVLGAWDYAIADPEAKLGGPLPAKFVGMMGFEFGGFAVQDAFGQEPRLKSILLDGAVHNVRALLDQLIDIQAPLSTGWLFRQQAWSRCEARAARKLHEDSVRVAEHLLAREAAGTIGIIHSVDDSIVPIQQHDLLLETLARVHDHGIKVTMEWYPSFGGDSNCQARREIHLDQPQEYRDFLCRFWGAAFLDDGVSMPSIKSDCPVLDYDPLPR